MNSQKTNQIILVMNYGFLLLKESQHKAQYMLDWKPQLKQKRETFQVVIDVIKNSTCIKAFTISADVPEILMQQFWYTITKIKGSESYEFLLADKRCVIDVEVFRKILDICPRKEGEDFTEVQNDEDTLTFLVDLGYSDIAYQIDHRREKKSRRENMPYPRFTKKSRGKGSQGKKSADPTEESVDMSDKSEPEPLIRRKTSSRRVKKKATISVDDNIIPEPDIALELGKSISLTEAEEDALPRHVHRQSCKNCSGILSPNLQEEDDEAAEKLTGQLQETTWSNLRTIVKALVPSDYVPPVVDKYLGTKLDDALLKTLERYAADLVKKYYMLPTLE
ncbi:hypothetical protein Tco_0658080 [Tanacetum coccineum]